jgi:NAD(P)-dependent dehydrogenase (short-subunit alcohol dehydrogenase family)
VSPVDLDGQVAVVTGAGAGLGRAYAIALAALGARVVVNDLGSEKDGTGNDVRAADSCVEEIRDAGGEGVASYSTVATPEGGEEIIRTASSNYGSLDILINNAGFVRDSSFGKMSVEDVRAVIGVHLMGAFHVTKPAFALMKEKGYGRIVFTSSAAGLIGNFGQANYGAAKMGIVGLSNVLAIEGARYGIKSNVIAPMAITRMTADMLADQEELFDPRRVAPMVVYLASSQCSVTHEVYSAGAGRYARMFVGVTRGWATGLEIPTASEIAKNIDAIRDESDYFVPAHYTEEVELIMSLAAD